MNRRNCLKLVGGTAVAITVLPIAGCSVKPYAQDALNALIAIYNADPGGFWAPDLELAIQDMQTAIADWNGSSVNCELQSGAQIAADILDSIPLGMTIDLLVTIALAAIKVLLSELAPCTTSMSGLRKHLSQVYSKKLHSVTPAYTMYFARYHGAAGWRMAPDMRGDFNRAAKAAGLPKATI